VRSASHGSQATLEVACHDGNVTSTRGPLAVVFLVCAAVSCADVKPLPSDASSEAMWICAADGPTPDLLARFDVFAATGEELRRFSVSARSVPWMRCGGLLPDGFEALADTLISPRSSDGPPVSAGEVTVSLDGRESLVRAIPVAVRNALSASRDAGALGERWSRAFRARRSENDEAAFQPGYGRDRPPPPDAERLRPYFAGLALELIELARIAVSTDRALYVHHPPELAHASTEP
jgi:hypothetical protein